ncbi:MAG TPA: diguanylate cyclase, partial [Hyphomonadaceae bacterium]|nr:diguanylate cyclase [Hyphomonadaceae bacterium]
ACRYGGEEFVVIMPDTNQALAQQAGERLRHLIESEPFTIGRGDALRITMSRGVATVYPPDDTLDSMLKRADEALYRAKSRGRNQIDVERVDV